MILSDILIQWRKESKYGLRKAAKFCNISPTYLSRLEQGKESNPSGEILLRISRVYNKHLDTIFLEAGIMPPDVIDTYRIANPIQRNLIIGYIRNIPYGSSNG